MCRARAQHAREWPLISAGAKFHLRPANSSERIKRNGCVVGLIWWAIFQILTRDMSMNQPKIKRNVVTDRVHWQVKIQAEISKSPYAAMNHRESKKSRLRRGSPCFSRSTTFLISSALVVSLTLISSSHLQVSANFNTSLQSPRHRSYPARHFNEVLIDRRRSFRGEDLKNDPANGETPDHVNHRKKHHHNHHQHHHLGHQPAHTRLKRRPKVSNQLPEFSAPIGNITAVVGRDVRLVCTVEHLGQYQVRAVLSG